MKSCANFNSIDEAEAERVRLVLEIQHIDMQLSDKNRGDAMGQREASFDYHAWHRKAVGAKYHLTAELQVIKLWMKQHRTASPSGKTAFVLIRDAVELLRRLQANGVDLDESELRLVDELAEYVEHEDNT